MKSGPVLNGWTVIPRATSAAIRPLAIVVLPQPLCVPAITTRGMSACMMMLFAGFAGIICCLCHPEWGTVFRAHQSSRDGGYFPVLWYIRRSRSR